jgi:hypothetical protein
MQASSWPGYQVDVDRGHYGAKYSLPQLNKFMKDAKGRRFDVVLV